MYMSIVHIGQIWYGYGWEIQLLETGFLSIFLCNNFKRVSESFCSRGVAAQMPSKPCIEVDS